MSTLDAALKNASESDAECPADCKKKSYDIDRSSSSISTVDYYSLLPKDWATIKINRIDSYSQAVDSVPRENNLVVQKLMMFAREFGDFVGYPFNPSKIFKTLQDNSPNAPCVILGDGRTYMDLIQVKEKTV